MIYQILALAMIFAVVYLGYRISLRTSHDLEMPVVTVSRGQSLSEVLEEAYEKYPDTAFVLPFTPLRVILPMSLLHEVAYAPRDQISFHGVLRADDQTRWTGISVLRREMIQAVRVNLTRNLGKALPLIQEELRHALGEELEGAKNKWVPVTLHSLLRRVVALIVGRLLLGLPLSRDERWLELSLRSSESLATVRTAVLRWNTLLQPLVVPFLDEVRAARKERRQAVEFIKPHLEDYLRSYDSGKPEMVQIGSQGTALFWMLGHVDQSSSASTSVMADNYLELMAVSVNGTTKACYQTIFDILSDPQCIPALREELRAVIAEHGMRQDSDRSQVIAKTTYTKSRLLDSCIKESLRCNPSQLIGMNRYLEKDHRFSNGMELKKGTFTSFNMWGVTHSSNTATYSPKLNAAVGNLGPEVHDSFRFGRLRTLPGCQNRYLAVSTGPEALNFGHGPAACPGRFFAVEVIKVIIVELLLRYDMQLLPRAEGKRPENIVIDQYVVLDRTAEVQIRRRA